METSTTSPRYRRDGVAPWLRDHATRLALTRVAIAGLLAIGISGAVAYGMGTAYGRSFVSGDAPGVTYSRARCADYFEYEPAARTCEQAATRHHFGETVGYRADAGILGMIFLVGYLFLRRRQRSDEAARTGLAPIIATGAFGVAAAGLLGQSFLLLARGQRVGIGDYLSAGIVSALAAVIAAIMWAGSRPTHGDRTRRTLDPAVSYRTGAARTPRSGNRGRPRLRR